MKLSSVEQAEHVKDLLLHELQEHQAPMSLQQLGLNLGELTKSESAPSYMRQTKSPLYGEVSLTNLSHQLSHRKLKEAAWQLVEEGKARFNSTWDLEIL